jgi:cell division protein FtsN
MSTRVEAPPIGGSFAGPILIAIVAAFVVGALMGTVVTKVVNDRLAASSGVAPARPLVVTPVGAPSWDAHKLEAMEGRALAEQYQIEQPVIWDDQKLEAMEGRALAEQFRGEQAVAWNAGKLQEMKGHQLAEQSRTEAMEDRQLAEDVHRHRPVGGPLG